MADPDKFAYRSATEVEAPSLGRTRTSSPRLAIEMVGNGYCARPVEMDCHFESICASCTFLVTTIEFRPDTGETS